MKCKYEKDCGHEVCVPDYCPEFEAGTVTNADRIRAMSDEELADFINHHNICNIRTGYECKISYCGICSQCVLDWLRQPVEEE